MLVDAKHVGDGGVRRGRLVAKIDDATPRYGAGFWGRVLALLLSLSLLGLAGCSGGSGSGTSAASDGEQPAAATAAQGGGSGSDASGSSTNESNDGSSAQAVTGGAETLQDDSTASLEWRVDGIDETVEVEEGQYYYDVEHVVTYLELYGGLPGNYITKKEARILGWQGGSVQRYLEDAAIGGDSFSNREGILPSGSGVKYHECDIDTDGAGSRGAKRLIYSSDGRYYYSDDHYESFVEYVVVSGVVTEAE